MSLRIIATRKRRVLKVAPSVRPSVRLSVCLSVCLSVRLSVPSFERNRGVRGEFAAERRARAGDIDRLRAPAAEAPQHGAQLQMLTRGAICGRRSCTLIARLFWGSGSQ